MDFSVYALDVLVYEFTLMRIHLLEAADSLFELSGPLILLVLVQVYAHNVLQRSAKFQYDFAVFEPSLLGPQHDEVVITISIQAQYHGVEFCLAHSGHLHDADGMRF